MARLGDRPGPPRAVPGEGRPPCVLAGAPGSWRGHRGAPSMAHAKVVVANDTVFGEPPISMGEPAPQLELQLRIADREVADHVAKELSDRDLLVATLARIPTVRRERAVNRAVSAIRRSSGPFPSATLASPSDGPVITPTHRIATSPHAGRPRCSLGRWACTLIRNRLRDESRSLTLMFAATEQITARTSLRGQLDRT